MKTKIKRFIVKWTIRIYLGIAWISIGLLALTLCHLYIQSGWASYEHLIKVERKPVEQFEQIEQEQSIGTREVTAYSEFDSCHTGASCKMASGKRAYVGAIACPREFKLGTKIKINDTIYQCEDRTASWVDGRFDIFMGFGQEAYDKAIQWGVKNLEVKIVI